MRSDPLAGGERPISSAARGKSIGERELIWMMALLMACNAFGIDAILPALDALASDLGVEGNNRQFVVGAYLLAAGIGTLIPGAFADRFGRRPVLFTALFFYIALSIACALATRFDMLIALRAAQGFFAAGIIALPPAIIRDRVGGDKMARMMSLIFVIFLLVPAVAPSIGQGVLMLMGDWRWIFGVMALAGVAMTAWVYVRLPETLHESDKQQIHLPTITRNMASAVTLRETIGYTLGSALVFGGLFGFILAALVVTYRMDQIIAGVVITLFVTGVTSYVSSQVFSEYRFLNNAPVFRAWKIPFLGDIPVIGPVLFNQNLFVYGALILVCVATYYLFYTRYGLRARSVGEHPRAADTLGINVYRTRYVNVTLAGITGRAPGL